MYIIPFCMGPIGSMISRYGVQITDHPYVAANMHLVVRVGTSVLQVRKVNLLYIHFVRHLEMEIFFLQYTQSEFRLLQVRKMLNGLAILVSNATNCYNIIANHLLAYFPDEPSVWSYGSLYGGNSMLAQKWFGLEVASVFARREGWMAEHACILSLKSPEGIWWKIESTENFQEKFITLLELCPLPVENQPLHYRFQLFLDGQFDAFLKILHGFVLEVMEGSMQSIQVFRTSLFLRVKNLDFLELLLEPLDFEM